MIVKGWLIDPKTRTITEAEHDTADYKQIYDLIDCRPSPFTIIHLDNAEDVIFIDDEGLLKNPRYFFTIENYPQPLAGRGLVLGTDPEGETIAPTITRGQLEKIIGYQELSVRDMTITEGPGWIKTEPVFGPPEDDE